MFTRLTDNFRVAAQISLADVAAAKAQGLVRIINNRPDGEVPGQPSHAQIEAAAEAQGLDYHYIPITPGQFTPDQVAALQAALADGQPTLAFCRSGTRSTLLWALVQATQGADFADVAAIAAQGGYDIAPIAPIFHALAAPK